MASTDNRNSSKESKEIIGGKESEEDAACPICLETLLVVTWRDEERYKLLCCGKDICFGCHRNLCKIWIGDLTLSHFTRPEEVIGTSGKCPMCRTDFPMTPAGHFSLVQQRVQERPDWAWAHFWLGMAYVEGVCCQRDLNRAFPLIQTAANMGHIPAYHALGDCYRLGHGVRKSEEDAILWYRKGVDEAHTLSQHDLGKVYHGQHKFQQAFQLFSLAALDGYDPSQSYLANCYEEGNGVEVSLEKSLYWNKKAADRGNAQAMAGYGGNLAARIREQNPPESDIFWFAGKNDAPEALYWVRKSEAAGYTPAKGLVDQLERQASVGCANCRLLAFTSKKKLPRCTECKAVSYCGRDCQRSHWKKHKLHCVNKNGEKKIQKPAVDLVINP